MKAGGFLCSWCVTQSINQEKQTPKVKTFIALALFAASIVGALAQTHVNGYYRTDGTYVQPQWRTGQVGTRNDDDIRNYRGCRGYGYSDR